MKLLSEFCFVNILFIAVCEPSSDFKTFLNDFNKSYNFSSSTYSKRALYFEQNKLTWTRLNDSRKTNASAYYGPTKFSDISAEEFKERYLSSYRSNNLSSTESVPVPTLNNDIPDKLDWRYNPTSPVEKVVTKVKNQKECGGCWAFAAVEAVESMHAVKTGSLNPLSVQEVLDCSRGFEVLSGCNGGDTCIALKWMKNRQVELLLESEYPLTDKTQKCQLSPKVQKHGVAVANYTCSSYAGVSEPQLLQLLASSGPLTVTVDATSWQNYQGGVIQYHCGVFNNHAVQIVGYDLTGEVPYYIVRNSWGEDWGHGGYLYIKYGDNVCGIAKEVSLVSTT